MLTTCDGDQSRRNDETAMEDRLILLGCGRHPCLVLWQDERNVLVGRPGKMLGGSDLRKFLG